MLCVLLCCAYVCVCVCIWCVSVSQWWPPVAVQLTTRNHTKTQHTKRTRTTQTRRNKAGYVHTDNWGVGGVCLSLLSDARGEMTQVHALTRTDFIHQQPPCLPFPSPISPPFLVRSLCVVLCLLVMFSVVLVRRTLHRTTTRHTRHTHIPIPIGIPIRHTHNDGTYSITPGQEGGMEGGRGHAGQGEWLVPVSDHLTAPKGHQEQQRTHQHMRHLSSRTMHFVFLSFVLC